MSSSLPQIYTDHLAVREEISLVREAEVSLETKRTEQAKVCSSASKSEP